jgi:putative ABC transport system substrate-binding protein
VFIQQLRQHGYVEGQNLVVEIRSAEGRPERLAALAAKLAHLGVDVIVAATNREILAAKQATSVIPIVMLGSHDAVGVGLVRSLARPGGNVTGMDTLAPDMGAKRLELLREILPKASRVAVLHNPGDPAMRIQLKHTQDAAQMLGLAIRPAEVQRPEDFERVFAALLQERPDGLLLFTNAFMFAFRQRIVEFAVAHRVPAIYEFKEFAQLGGLVSYGASLRYLNVKAADFVARILRGARPAELPVEHPTEFELVINLKTAKALGLSIPESVRLRATGVIE